MDSEKNVKNAHRNRIGMGLMFLLLSLGCASTKELPQSEYDFNALADRLCQGDPQLTRVYATKELVAFRDDSAEDPHQLLMWRIHAPDGSERQIDLSSEDVGPYLCGLRNQQLIVDGQSPPLAEGHFISWCGWIDEEGNIVWGYKV